MKTCTRCGESRPLDGYYKTPSGNLRKVCKICIVTYQKERTKTSEVYKERRNGYVLKHRFNITQQDYNDLLESQGGVCAICDSPEPGDVRTQFSVDHDRRCCAGSRSCGKCVRGLLCARCNTGIGLLRDDRKVLERAIVYLEKWIFNNDEQ